MMRLRGMMRGMRTMVLRRRSICSQGAGGGGGGADEELVVKVTSQSLIKPSSPTPANLRHFKLSLLDAIQPSPLHPTFVLFYPPQKNNNTDIINATKQQQLLLRGSLSQILTRFYPLAGRIEAEGSKDWTIECNDEGAEYLEAEANQGMLQFLGTASPNAQLLSRLAPPRPRSSFHAPLACVQTTLFPCGGISVGVCLNHLFADGHTFGMFVRQWAALATARGDEDCQSAHVHVHVHDTAASVFPICDAVLSSKPLNWREPSSLLTHHTSTSNTHTSPTSNTSSSIVSQRFVFQPSAVLALKSTVASGQLPNPSRSVAIFALIWRTAMKAHYANAMSMPSSDPPPPRTTSSSPSSFAYTSVDLRPKLETESLGSSVGNLVWQAVAQTPTPPPPTTASHHHRSLRQLAHELKKSIEKVDGEFVESLKSERGHKKIGKWLDDKGKGESAVKGYAFSSVLKMGLDQVDFGWGMPTWVTYLGVTDSPVPYFVFLVEATAGGDDDANDDAGPVVEAYVSLADKEMAIFEKDADFLRYATVNPKVV